MGGERRGCGGIQRRGQVGVIVVSQQHTVHSILIGGRGALPLQPEEAGGQIRQTAGWSPSWCLTGVPTGGPKEVTEGPSGRGGAPASGALAWQTDHCADSP